MDLLPRTYRLLLKPGRERSLNLRHSWIYSGAVDVVESLEDAQPGDLGDVLTAGGDVLGVATVNPASQIAGRVLVWGRAHVDRSWLVRRLSEAWRLRQEIVDRSRFDAFRWIHGEGDALPGLVVDVYGRFLAVQTPSLFWHRNMETLATALAEISGALGVVQKMEGAVRDPQVPGGFRCVAGLEPPGRLEIREGDVRLLVDLAAGQKTGLYLDQRENRDRLARLGAGRDVLVAFAYTGSFGLHAAAAGARKVVFVETSEPALDLMRENFARNGIEDAKVEVHREDAWSYMRRETSRFDLIIVDPPALAKASRHVPRAARGYKDINLHAIRRLAPAGWLATFSCSQHVSADLFQKILFGASLDAGVPLRCVERLGPPRDHPVALDHPQGDYLKGMLLRAASESGDEPAAEPSVRSMMPEATEGSSA